MTWFERFKRMEAEQTPTERLVNPSGEPLDLELSAIRTIYSKLKALAPEARVRVWRYVEAVLGSEP